MFNGKYAKLAREWLKESPAEDLKNNKVIIYAQGVFDFAWWLDKQINKKRIKSVD